MHRGTMGTMIDWDAIDGHYFDRNGTPISLNRYSELMTKGVDADGRYGADSYKRVDEDTVGRFRVSTVWLGLDHNWISDGEPIIFETMVFDHGTDRVAWDQDCYRYATEAAAREGHARVVADLRAGREPWFVTDDT